MAAVGEAFLSAAIQFALDKLASPLLKEFGSRLGVDKDLKKLGRILCKIQAVLDDAEQREITDKAVELWLNDLKHVAFDADDLLDEVATEAMRFSHEMNQVSNFLSLPKDFLFKLELGPKMKKIMERLEEISSEREDLNLREGMGKRWREVREERPQTSSLVDESCVFGRTLDANKIVEMLVQDDNCSVCTNVSVVTIVGMGGLGKTTLAQLVYNDEKVMGHFELMMWICVSDDFDVRRITRSIIEAATNKDCDLKNLDPLQSHLQKILKGKRFLLVLDDVWNEKRSDWDVLRLPLRVGGKGSKIIVTTRSEKVLAIMGTTMPYKLSGLSDDDCWSLFKQRAFVDGNLDVHPKLLEIGTKIVKKCRGLPLAVKTLGGLLYCKVNEEDWIMILNSDIWDLEGNESEILPALLLSYDHLPSHLKQCFAYCSIFSMDYMFEKEKLVQLWIAEGFVQSKQQKSLEDVGCEYFDDLLLRSFFQYSSADKSGFVMHDLIHNLARFVSRDICFMIDGRNPCNVSEKARHLSLLRQPFMSIKLDAFHIAGNSRTFLQLAQGSVVYPSRVPIDLILNLRRLRVLDLKCCSIIELPNSIGKLKHLRYLDLAGNRFKRLPESICNLCNLQTLILYNCCRLLELPKVMKNLTALRNLDLVGCSHLLSMPQGIGELTCLQKLNRFVLSRESKSGIKELKELEHIRGELHIIGVEGVASFVEAKEANLKNKRHIQELQLVWRDGDCSLEKVLKDDSPDEVDEEEMVLQGLQPHINLKKLEIEGYNGMKFPCWVGDSSFSHLVNIEFSSCKNCNILPPLGQLPALKHLVIEAMDGLERVGREFYGVGSVKGFSMLETLGFSSMKELKEWNGIEDQDFPRLRELSIQYCPKLTNLPRFPCLYDLYLYDCHEMILSSLPYLTSLSSLEISSFDILSSFPKGMLCPLNVLRKLAISSCSQLIDLQDEVGLQDLISLQHLKISNCSELKFLPKGIRNLSSLEKLEIRDCPQLTSIPAEGLPAILRHVEISQWPNLQALPTGLHQLTIS